MQKLIVTLCCCFKLIYLDIAAVSCSPVTSRFSVGSIWVEVDGQAGPCMGRCIVWYGAWLHDVWCGGGGINVVCCKAIYN